MFKSNLIAQSLGRSSVFNRQRQLRRQESPAPASGGVTRGQSNGFLNKVLLIGNVGREPEVKTFPDGVTVTSFPLATNDVVIHRNGQRMIRTEWHRVVILNPRLSQIASKIVTKGAKVYLEGTLRTRKWTDAVTKQELVVTEVILSNRSELQLLRRAEPIQENLNDRQQKSQSSAQAQQSQSQAEQQQQQQPQPQQQQQPQPQQQQQQQQPQSQQQPGASI